VFTIKNNIIIILQFIILSILFSCNNVESYKSGAVQIRYTGVEEGEYGSVASFLLVNDSTETVEFWAYGEEFPHYSTEVLTDTGWIYLMWNWCGTGTSPVEFKPGDKMKFTTSLPNYNCTWRVLLGVSVVDSENYYTVKSNEIIYSIPE